jgi:hypothetical protein
VGHRVGIGVMEKRKIPCLYRESMSDSSVVQLAALWPYRLSYGFISIYKAKDSPVIGREGP